jgi:hypothetical protein
MAAGDVNNDGLPDLLVTEYGALHLFLNQGNGKFVDVTKQAGLNSQLWGTSASFFDFDRDGWLDLVVANYVDYDPARPCAAASGQRDYCSPAQFLGSVPKLYHNLGARVSSQSGVRFEDVTLVSGLGKARSGLGVVCLDFSGDHWPDILIANDGQPNRLWINQRNGVSRIGVRTRYCYNANGQPQANMGIAVADVNRDGLFDVFITHLTEETHTLWQQQPPGLFEDRTAAAGLAQQFRATGFGTVLADFNHDGVPDLAIANGRVSRSKPGGAAGLDSFWDRYAERNQLFTNDGQGHFRDISASTPALSGTPGVARGLACGDMDGDGALDLLITGAGPARLLRNVTPKRGHWLMVRAMDPALRRDAYGAEITVRAGGNRFRGWLNPGYSYLCSNDPRVHFGLGAAARVDGVEVTWPDGTLEAFGPLEADRTVTLRKGEGHVEQK